jgi:hypothetical protein
MSNLSLLKTAVSGLGSAAFPAGTFGDAWIRSLGFAKAKMVLHTQRVNGITPQGLLSLTELTEAIFKSSPRLRRGTNFNKLLDAAHGILLSEFHDKPPDDIDAADLKLIESKIADWFDGQVADRTHFIPCTVFERQIPPFSIGPVSLLHIADFSLHKQSESSFEAFDLQFGTLLQLMSLRSSHWIAVIEVKGCEETRSTEVADISVDIALGGLCLAFPNGHIARTTGRTRSPRTATVISRGDDIQCEVRNDMTELAMPAHAAIQLLQSAKELLDSVGRRVTAYLAGQSKFMTLEQPWCDACYWYHEALAESLDTVAVPKLETAVEVLLRAESTSGSSARMRAAFKAFFGLGPEQLIPGSLSTTVEALIKSVVTSRSRVLHGTWSTLAEDLRLDRAELVRLVRSLLIEYTTQLDRFMQDANARDDRDTFMKWVEDHRAARQT